MQSTVVYSLILSAMLFSMGVLGVIIRRHPLVMFMCIELMLNSVNLAFLALGRYFGQLDGAIFVFFIMAVSAAEAAVGVAITVAFIRRNKTTSIDAANLMKW